MARSKKEMVALAICEGGKEVCGLPPNKCRHPCKGCLHEAKRALEAIEKWDAAMAKEANP